MFFQTWAGFSQITLKFSSINIHHCEIFCWGLRVCATLVWNKQHFFNTEYFVIMAFTILIFYSNNKRDFSKGAEQKTSWSAVLGYLWQATDSLSIGSSLLFHICDHRGAVFCPHSGSRVSCCQAKLIWSKHILELPYITETCLIFNRLKQKRITTTEYLYS
jgi:hypothetical protein